MDFINIRPLGHYNPSDLGSSGSGKASANNSANQSKLEGNQSINTRSIEVSPAPSDWNILNLISNNSFFSLLEELGIKNFFDLERFIIFQALIEDIQKTTKKVAESFLFIAKNTEIFTKENIERFTFNEDSEKLQNLIHELGCDFADLLDDRFSSTSSSHPRTPVRRSPAVRTSAPTWVASRNCIAGTMRAAARAFARGSKNRRASPARPGSAHRHTPRAR